MRQKLLVYVLPKITPSLREKERRIERNKSKQHSGEVLLPYSPRQWPVVSTIVADERIEQCIQRQKVWEVLRCHHQTECGAGHCKDQFPSGGVIWQSFGVVVKVKTPEQEKNKERIFLDGPVEPYSIQARCP